MDKKTHRELKRATKKRLKSLSKNRQNHHAYSAGRILKYGSFGFARNLWLSLVSTLVMSITLIITVATLTASTILSSTANSIREKIDITIFLKPGLDSQKLSELEQILKQDSNIKSLTTSDSATEFNNFLREKEQDKELKATLEDPEMRAIMLKSIPATMRLKVHNIDDISTLKHIVENHEIFSEHLDSKRLPTYDLNRNEINTISSWASIAKNTGLILGIIFLIISVLVIFNTVRMAIFSRREEIYMMKLVGASHSFIRGPFLVEAEISGLLSGLIASGSSLLGLNFLLPKLETYGVNVASIRQVLESNQIYIGIFALIFAGISIGLVSALLALRKYLR